MNPERLQFKGMLAESKKKYRALDTEASGLILFSFPIAIIFPFGNSVSMQF